MPCSKLKGKESLKHQPGAGKSAETRVEISGGKSHCPESAFCLKETQNGKVRYDATEN